jgi:hypothetical protein
MISGSIATGDLNNYKTLQLYFKDLYDKIKAGKSIVTVGADDFEVFHNKLFPENTEMSYIKSTDGLATDSNGFTTINSNGISLKKLLHNTLYPTFHQTLNTSIDASTSATDNYAKYSNMHIPNGVMNKEHLCFIKFNSGKTDIEPDNYAITNILYSKYSIEIFIKIIEALKDCYSKYEKEFLNNFSSDTQIFIVDKKLKSDHVDNVPKGIFINDYNYELESPPNGIYLYIGNLRNMFKDDDIFIYESGATSASDIALSTKNTYLGKNEAIFKPNNKLNIFLNNKYYFGCLEYVDTSSSSKYPEQTGVASERRITKNSTSITGSGGAIISTKIVDASIRTNLADITNFKLKSTATIEKVSSTGYKINGKFDCTITTGTLTGGSIPSTDNTITATGTFNLNPQNAEETFDSTSIIKSGSIKAGTISLIPVTNKDFHDSLILTNISGGLGSGVTLPTIIGTRVTIPSDTGFLTLSGTSPITISHTFDTATNITDPTIENAYIEKIKVTMSADNMRSFYRQNIYYSYNFIKMINNINKDSFSTTIKYLHVYLLCYKSLLLASIRAANIFYNNRYNLSAMAISYEDKFLYNKTPITNGGCAKTSLNDFIKNDNNALFSTTATCSGTDKLPNDTSSVGKKYKYILYKKRVGATQDNDEVFKDYDVYIQQELGNIKKTKVTTATSDLGITNFKLFSSFKLKGNFIITSDDTNVNDKLTGGIFENSTPDNEYSYIKDMFINNKIYNFNKNYRISINGSSFKVVKFTTRKDSGNLDRIDIELEHDKSIPTSLFNILISKATPTTPLPVFIVKITSKDIDRDYNNIVSNTDVVEQNINMYKTKIKNNTTLYELHKSRNNLLYNQVLSYLIIVVILISILIIINIAGVEKPLVKSITLGCFSVIILLFMSYYIINTLYIEEGFTGSANTYPGYDLCSSADCKKTDSTSLTGKENENSSRIRENKMQDVKNFLNINAKDLILMIILETPSIVNDSLKGNNEKLVEMSKNIYNEKKYLKDVLYSKKSDTEMNVDVLKYENKNYDVYITCVLFLALIIVGSYTVNIYTDNKYLDLLILIMVILLVCLFTYFVLYTNRVVRTVSANYYWGNEYENEYI